jgi:hypothetical protein
MSSTITLTAYLAQRGVKAKALTRGEAELLDIPFPLQRGWARKHGSMVIEEEVLPQLVTHAAAARQVAEEKAMARSVKPRTTAPVAAQLSLAMPSSPARVSPVPGFVLRQARRYRPRGSAPWA